MKPGSNRPAFTFPIGPPTLFTMADNRMDGDALILGENRVAQELTRRSASYEFRSGDPIRGVYAPERNDALVLGRHSPDLYLAAQAMLRFRSDVGTLMGFEAVVLGGEFVFRAPVVREALTTAVREHAFAPSEVAVWRDGHDVDGPIHVYRLAYIARVLGIPAGSRARFEWTDPVADNFGDELDDRIRAAIEAEDRLQPAPQRFDGDLEELYRIMLDNGFNLPTARIDRSDYRSRGGGRGGGYRPPGGYGP